MSGEEHYSSGGVTRKALTQEEKKRMRERMAESESIRELSSKHHQEHEVPKAEEELLKDLENINKKDN